VLRAPRLGLLPPRLVGPTQPRLGERALLLGGRLGVTTVQRHAGPSGNAVSREAGAAISAEDAFNVIDVILALQRFLDVIEDANGSGGADGGRRGRDPPGW